MAARSGTTCTLKLPLPRVRERSERGPRRRKFKVYKRCRVSRRVLRAKRAGPEETEVDSGQDTSEIRDKINLNFSIAYQLITTKMTSPSSVEHSSSSSC
ncbi:hypothetical protein TYRP_011403 [Tyrophagus putrescentiae]|nr:hypothetical protein TYRP_011403 [Tyrophagus putrescentiae]